MKASPREQTVFAGAMLCDSPEGRAAYLSAACGTDTVLRQRVEALLRAADHAGEFLEQPPDGLTNEAVGDPLTAVESPDRTGGAPPRSR